MKPLEIAMTVSSIPALLIAVALYHHLEMRDAQDTGLAAGRLATEFAARAVATCPESSLPGRKDLHADVFATVSAAAQTRDGRKLLDQILQKDGLVLTRPRGDVGNGEFLQSGNRWVMVLPPPALKGAGRLVTEQPTLDFISAQANRKYELPMNGPPHGLFTPPCPE